MTNAIRPGPCLAGLVAIGAAWLTVGCATAPPAQPPALTSEQKLVTIIQLEHQRVLQAPDGAVVEGAVPSTSLAPPPMPSLGDLLHDVDDRVRRRAAIAIGRVGSVAGVAWLVPALEDPHPSVRQMVAFALGLIGGVEATEPLLRALTDPDPITSGWAAMGLARLGADQAAPAIGAMVATRVGAVVDIEPDDLTYPQTSEAEAFRMGVIALGLLDAYEPMAAAVLAADGRPLVRWWPVAWALQDIADPRSSVALSDFVQGQGSYGVAFAAQGLGAVGDAAGVDLLLPLLDPTRYDSQVIVAGIRALASQSDPRITPALVELIRLRDLAPAVQLETVTALGVRGVPETTDLFLDLLSLSWPPLRAAAVRNLARLDERMFMLVLSGFDVDPHWSVRAELARVLGTLPTDLALPRLRGMLEDPDRRVTPAVLSALVAVRAPEAAALSLELLRNDDAVIRMVAAEQLGLLRPPEGLSALVAAYRTSAGAAASAVRVAIVDALARYGTADAVAALRAALPDDDWRVRVRAAGRLAALDPANAYGDQIGTAPGVSREVALRLVDPEVSPQVFLDTDKGTIQIELAVSDAPVATETFATLAASAISTACHFTKSWRTGSFEAVTRVATATEGPATRSGTK